MAGDLPAFRYHPDPLATGSIVESTAACRSCGQSRSYVYNGPVYADDDVPDSALCPWCIADGTAASKFAAEFADVGSGVPTDIADAVLDELSHRTPGFYSWQQDHWLYHCGDACAFLGRVGRPELDDHLDAMEMLLHENDSFGWSGEQSRLYVDSLDADGETTAYLFRCLSCDVHVAFSDGA
jgi:uncharacterized protein